MRLNTGHLKELEPQQQLASFEVSKEPLQPNSSRAHQYKKGNLLFNFGLESNYFNHLQYLTLARCSLNKKAIQYICCNCILRNLRALDLAENPIGNNGMKYLADSSNWAELQILILQRTQINYQGVKYLSLNESWIDLKELDLSQNSNIGNLGAMNLSLNRTWRNLKKLSLQGCDLTTLGIKFLERNKNLRDLITETNSTAQEREESQNYKSRRFSLNTGVHELRSTKRFESITTNSQMIRKVLRRNKATSFNECMQVGKNNLRGGSL